MCLYEILGEYVITDTKTHVHLTLIPSWLSLRSFLDWFTVILSEGQEELTVWKPPTRTAYKSEALLANNKTNTYAEKNRSQRTLIHSQSSRERKNQRLTKKKKSSNKTRCFYGLCVTLATARRRQIFCIVAQMFSINPEFPITPVPLVPPPARCK